MKLISFLLSVLLSVSIGAHGQNELNVNVIEKNKYDKIKKNHSLFYYRRGKLFNKFEIIQTIKENLKPLDILAEKAPFRLSDKFIPGHFGHIAIWVGTKEELIEKGLWDTDLIKPFQFEIEANTDGVSKNIIEAVPSGVRLISLEDFLNADDVAVIRPQFLNTNDQKETLLFTFKQLGKKYDFNFDVSTTDKIVCSELAYVCFPKISWQTVRFFGRKTITPDNIVNTCINNFNFKLITFYHKGKEMRIKERLRILKQLTKKSAIVSAITAFSSAFKVSCKIRNLILSGSNPGFCKRFRYNLLHGVYPDL